MGPSPEPSSQCLKYCSRTGDHHAESLPTISLNGSLSSSCSTGWDRLFVVYTVDVLLQSFSLANKLLPRCKVCLLFCRVECRQRSSFLRNDSVSSDRCSNIRRADLHSYHMFVFLLHRFWKSRSSFSKR